MSYTQLALTGIIGAVVIDAAILRTWLVRRRTFWASYAILLLFQLVVNGVLTGLGVVRYSPGTILGARIAYAPVEDIGFGFSLILITLSCWVAVQRSPAHVREHD